MFMTDCKLFTGSGKNGGGGGGGVVEGGARNNAMSESPLMQGPARHPHPFFHDFALDSLGLKCFIK